MRILGLFLLLSIFAGQRTLAQQPHDDMNMPSMETKGNATKFDPLLENIVMHALSGTDLQPSSVPSDMLMRQFGDWTVMFHGEAFLNEIQQSGMRGSDKLFSTNWFMPMAQRKFGNGTLTLRSMLSFDPATITHRRYPEMFQQGETAYGLPIVDGQHPHDFVMEAAAMFDFKLNEKSALSVYAALVGDPALGPPAYPHRASASEDPIAPLGHHLEDSTHIANDVITVGFTHRNFRIEGSGFHGREPNEYRWDIDSGRVDSWSARLTVNPAKNWSFQYSLGQLHSPEALAASEDVRRMTASLIYSKAFRDGDWASMLLWGRNQSLQDGNVGNAYLLESTVKFLRRNSLWTRVENVDRTNELLLGENPLPAGFTERYFVRVQAYTAGYDREFGRLHRLSTALGAQITWYGVPAVLKPTYGAHSLTALVFLRVRVKSERQLSTSATDRGLEAADSPPCSYPKARGALDGPPDSSP